MRTKLTPEEKRANAAKQREEIRLAKSLFPGFSIESQSSRYRLSLSPGDPLAGLDVWSPKDKTFDSFCFYPSLEELSKIIVALTVRYNTQVSVLNASMSKVEPSTISILEIPEAMCE